MGNTNQKAIITGGAGFIGSHLADRMLSEGYSVLVIDDLSSGSENNLESGIELEKISITDKKMHSIIHSFSPTVVFHCAAQISVSISTREPARDAEINLLGSINLLEGIKNINSGPVKFVFLSTGGAMYGEPSVLPVPENYPTNPRSPYGASKRAVELYLPIYGQNFNIRPSVLRLANIYGPRQDPHGEAGVIAIFTNSMLAEKRVTVFGDGNDERDYVYVADAIEALTRSALMEGGMGPFNVGTGRGTTVNEIFRLLSDLCGYNMDPRSAPPRQGDIHKITLDSNKIRDALGWVPQKSLSNGLAETVSWFRNNS